jgi:hypothetical protein
VADAPDTQQVASVDDHAFVPRPNQPWERCLTCGLAEAAHTTVHPADSYANHLAWRYGDGTSGSA